MREYKIIRLFFWAVVFLVACSSENEKELSGNEWNENDSQILQKELILAIERTKQNGDDYIDLKKITNFSWDKVYIFTPYTSKEQVNEELGFTWSKVDSTGIHFRDDINLIVFIKDKKVVKNLEYPRSYGDFADIKKKGDFKPEAAKFQVIRKLSSGQDWIKMIPIQ